MPRNKGYAPMRARSSDTTTPLACPLSPRAPPTGSSPSTPRTAPTSSFKIRQPRPAPPPRYTSTPSRVPPPPLTADNEMPLVRRLSRESPSWDSVSQGLVLARIDDRQSSLTFEAKRNIPMAKMRDCSVIANQPELAPTSTGPSPASGPHLVPQSLWERRRVLARALQEVNSTSCTSLPRSVQESSPTSLASRLSSPDATERRRQELVRWHSLAFARSKTAEPDDLG